MQIVAHRGYASAFPENTRAAFTQAAQTADWIELDVRPCETGELVVFHDERLDDLTNGTGRVVATPWAELSELEVLESGERVPLLDEALAAIPGDVGVQIELKDLGMAQEVLETTADHDNESILISFSPLALYEAAQADASADLGFVLHPGLYGDAPGLGVETAAHLGCKTVHAFHPMGTAPEFIELAHDHGLNVQTGAPDEGPTEAVVERYRASGVDFFSVDEPPRGS